MSDEAGPLAVPIYVRHYRKLKGMTQERLADAAGLSTTSVHNLEAGKNGFSDKSLRQIASALELQPHELLTPPGAMIDSDPAILAMLGRISGLNDADITTAFSVISNARKVNMAGSEQAAPRGQSKPATRRRAPEPLR